MDHGLTSEESPESGTILTIYTGNRNSRMSTWTCRLYSNTEFGSRSQGSWGAAWKAVSLKYRAARAGPFLSRESTWPLTPGTQDTLPLGVSQCNAETISGSCERRRPVCRALGETAVMLIGASASDLRGKVSTSYPALVRRRSVGSPPDSLREIRYSYPVGGVAPY